MAALAALLAIPLGVHLSAAMDARYLADDYCWPQWINDAGGFWAFQERFYETYTGRWGNTAGASVLSYLGVSTPPYVLSISLVAWYLSVVWCTYELTKKLWPSVVIAEVIVLSVLFAAPGDAHDVVYWQSGMVAYLAPVVIAAVTTAAAVRWNAGSIAAAGAFVATAFNESFMLLQVLVLVGAVVLMPRSRRLTIPALLGATLGVLSVVLAPGALGRQSLELERGAAGTPGLFGSIKASLAFAVAYGSLALATGGLLAYFAGGALARELRVTVPTKTLLLTIPLVFVVVFPSIFAVGYVSPRTFFPGVVSVVVIALLAGSNVRWRSPVLAMPLLLVFVGLATWNVTRVAEPIADYARRWDQMDAQLNAASGQGTLVRVEVVDDLVPWIWRIQSDPDWVVNRCIATMYEVGGVAGPEVATR